MRSLFFVLSLMCCLAIYGQKHEVTDKNLRPMAYATVTVCNADSIPVETLYTNEDGMFSLDSMKVLRPLVKISMLGYKTMFFQDTIPQTIVLEEDENVLNEIIVKGKQQLVKMSESGFIYEMERNKRAQQENLLTAIKDIPLIEVSSEGIKIKGQSEYRIYLNGKRFDMAEANPSRIFQAIPASTIKEIEIVTNPDSRFLNDTGTPIINIKTKKVAFEGLFLNLGIGGTTQPTAKSGLSFLGGKKEMDFAIEYDYDLYGQMDQPLDIDYELYQKTTKLNGHGDGYFHTHTLRAMLNYKVNDMNHIYADIHTKINKTNFKMSWLQSVISDAGLVTNLRDFNNTNRNTTGTAEMNLIYRNYYNNEQNTERFSIGYRYTYNPDSHKFIQSGNDMKEVTINTDGALKDHTINISCGFPIAKYHLLGVGFRDVYRIGSTASTDESDISYHQNVSIPYIKYILKVKGMTLGGKISGEMESLKMESAHEANNNFSKNDIYLTAALQANFAVRSNMRLSADFSHTTQRPTIEMLNPFCSVTNDYSASVGNPLLKNEKKNIASLTYSLFAKQFYFMAGVNYELSTDGILYYEKGFDEKNRLISTYGNLGDVQFAGANLYANWRPKQFFSITCDVNGGYYGISSSDIKLSQNDYTINLTSRADFYIPKNWSVRTMFGFYKQRPEPWSTTNSFINYSFRVEKTWWKGALTVGVDVNSPFQKYIKSQSVTTKHEYISRQTNYIIARSFGVDISYTFNVGKKVNIERDRTLRNLDIQTGVE